jgi:endonuclease YncB( thermonuclease family)
MPFVAIAGTFHAANYQPDGDSIRFKPANPALLARLTGPAAKLNTRGHAQLRIEAIDTLETHYAVPGGGGTHHQPNQWAHAARARLLNFVGIGNVVWDQAGNSVLSAADGTPGYILSRAVEKNRRPIAFVFAGTLPEADGADVMLDPQRLRQSYNWAALNEGLAHATYYEGLFADLRNELTAAVTAARTAGRGLWPGDATHAGFDAVDLASITVQIPIMPKLFRRLIEFMVNYGTSAGFKEKMAQSREGVFDLVDSNFTHFDTFIDQQPGSTRIRLTRNPEQLVFSELPQRPPEAFSLLMGNESLVLDETTEARLANVQATMQAALDNLV